MSATSFHEYARNVEGVLNGTVALGQAVTVSLSIDQRSSRQGFIAGIVRLSNGSELHFREFVDLGLSEPRLMYAYHYQNERGDLIFRYDNAAHRPSLPKPEHKHTSAGTTSCQTPTLVQVVDEVLLHSAR